jgi:hypothetical protein
MRTTDIMALQPLCTQTFLQGTQMMLTSPHLMPGRCSRHGRGWVRQQPYLAAAASAAVTTWQQQQQQQQQTAISLFRHTFSIT